MGGKSIKSLKWKSDKLLSVNGRHEPQEALELAERCWKHLSLTSQLTIGMRWRRGEGIQPFTPYESQPRACLPTARAGGVVLRQEHRHRACVRGTSEVAHTWGGVLSSQYYHQSAVGHYRKLWVPGDFRTMLCSLPLCLLSLNAFKSLLLRTTLCILPHHSISHITIQTWYHMGITQAYAAALHSHPGPSKTQIWT